MLSPPVPCATSASCSSLTDSDIAITYVAAGEVTALKHELGDDAVEDGALVVEGLSRFAGTLLTSAEGAEVLSSLSIVVSWWLATWNI